VTNDKGEAKAMRDLKLGEKVMSVNDKGEIVFSEVIMFLDREINVTREFVQIKTDGGAVLQLTPAHLLPVWKPHKNHYHQNQQQRHNQLLSPETKYRFADQVEENDFVLVNVNSNLEPQRVIEINTISSRGFIAPLTREGTIVVNSIASSCYALVNSQSLAHISFMPFRTIKTINNWFGDDTKQTSNQVGLNWYAKTLYTVKDFVLPNNYLYAKK
jgi:hedgehog protein